MIMHLGLQRIVLVCVVGAICLTNFGAAAVDWSSLTDPAQLSAVAASEFESLTVENASLIPGSVRGPQQR
jgi:hypothetical protein